MSQKTQTFCDVCDAVKRDVNHWWKVWVECGVFHVAKFDHEPDNVDAVDVCGQEHAMVCLNRFLTHGTLEEHVAEARIAT